MKKEILERIEALGGNIDQMKGNSFEEDWQSITFDCVLYGDSFAENIWGIFEFCDKNWDVYLTDEKAFFEKMLNEYYYLALKEEGRAYGQLFFTKNRFTPFTIGTDDYNEWNSFFEETVDRNMINELTGEDNPEFVQVFYSYGYPDHYFISVNDSNQDNPTILGTDHEEFFSEINDTDTLEELLNSFLTQDEFLELVKESVEEYKMEKK